MPTIWFDDKGNCYEELDPEETLPTDAYVWFFNGIKPIGKAPTLLGLTSVDKINRAVLRYKQGGTTFANAKFLKKRKPPPEEECKSPGCKRRMKNCGKPCHWCGRI